VGQVSEKTKLESLLACQMRTQHSFITTLKSSLHPQSTAGQLCMELMYIMVQCFCK